MERPSPLLALPLQHFRRTKRLFCCFALCALLYVFAEFFRSPVKIQWEKRNRKKEAILERAGERAPTMISEEATLLPFLGTSSPCFEKSKFYLNRRTNLLAENLLVRSTERKNRLTECSTQTSKPSRSFHRYGI